MLENTDDITSKNNIISMIRSSLPTNPMIKPKLSAYQTTNVDKHKLMLERAKENDDKTFAMKSFRESIKNTDRDKYNEYINESVKEDSIKQLLLSSINDTTKEEKPLEYLNTKDALKEIQTVMYKREWHKLPDVHKINRIIEFIKKNKVDKNNYNDTINILIARIKEKKLNNKIVQYNTKEGIIESIKGLKFDSNKYVFTD